MHKNSTYREKFSHLRPLNVLLFQQIKRDLKNEHLSKNSYFMRKFFAGKTLNQLTTSEMADVYSQAIQQEEKGEELAEFITSRWLLRKQDLYGFFENALKQIHPEFDEIETLSLEQSRPLVVEAVHLFGIEDTYLFAILNSVVFPPAIFEQLKVDAESSLLKKSAAENEEREHASLLQLNHHLERELVRLQSKFERKMAALEKKHHSEIESLKKQLIRLQQ